MRRPSPPRAPLQGQPQQDQPGKTLQEREAEYEKARSRILKNGSGSNSPPPLQGQPQQDQP